MQLRTISEDLVQNKTILFLDAGMFLTPLGIPYGHCMTRGELAKLNHSDNGWNQTVKSL
jgi:hypothetical protein